MYPPGIFDILNHVNEVKEYVVEVCTGDLGTDELKLHVCVDGNRQKVEELLRTTFQSRLRVVPLFEFVTHQEIEKLQNAGRKIKKFIDNRK